MFASWVSLSTASHAPSCSGAVSQDWAESTTVSRMDSIVRSTASMPVALSSRALKVARSSRVRTSSSWKLVSVITDAAVSWNPEGESRWSCSQDTPSHRAKPAPASRASIAAATLRRASEGRGDGEELTAPL